MNAEIEKETDKGFGVTVHDNNSIKHKIGVLYDGQINGHLQDGYSDDPGKRTNDENEYVNQARRYARWYVYRNRGYDTVPPTENPDRILAVALALTQLPEATFLELFGHLAEKIRAHSDESAVEVPFEDAAASDILVYQTDVYLQSDPTTHEPPVLDQFLTLLDDDATDADFDRLNKLRSLQFDLEAVSGVHTIHHDGATTEQIDRGTDPLEREPDATIELLAFDPDEIDSFHRYVVSHLFYQIRDCFLQMGETPPPVFRSQGWGKYEAAKAQRVCSFYEAYWSPQATIDSWDPANP